MYPMFINKATYYEKGIASIQAEKLTFSVPALPRWPSPPTQPLTQAGPAQPQPSHLNNGSRATVLLPGSPLPSAVYHVSGHTPMPPYLSFPSIKWKMSRG